MSFDAYLDAPATTEPRLRQWFIGALVISLVLHGCAFVFFHFNKLEKFNVAEKERLVPRPFSIKPTQIDPKFFEPEKPEPKLPEKVIITDSPHKLPDIPLDKPGEIPDNVTLTPQAPPENVKSLLTERPGVVDAAHSKVAPPQSNDAVERDLDQARRSLIKKDASVVSDAQMKLPASDTYGDPQSGTGKGKGNTPGFSNLDDLLAQSGPLTGAVAPLNMPGGALFAYDSAQLQGGAIATLQKLGRLIHRNPLATFSIEGHTDSFGDPEYNLQLSKARAEAVKEWLVKNMRISPERIRTQGFGSTRLIVPASGNEEQQQMNRRVEIVIRTPNPR